LRSTGLDVPGELFDSSSDFSVSEEGAALFVGRPGRPPKKINEAPNFFLILSESGPKVTRPIEVSSSPVARLDMVAGGKLIHCFREQVPIRLLVGVDKVTEIAVFSKNVDRFNAAQRALLSIM
jgi:hypothetical protein